MATVADKSLETTISALGGKGAFSKEVQQLVQVDEADLAVHSAKDLQACLLYTSPSPRDKRQSRMPSSA